MSKKNGSARRAQRMSDSAFRPTPEITLNHAVVAASATSANADSPAGGSAVQVKGSKAGKASPYTHDLDATQVKRLGRGYRNAVVSGAGGFWLFCKDLAETIDATRATYKTVALRLGAISETIDDDGELQAKFLTESQVSRYRSAYREGIKPTTDPKGLGIDPETGPTSLYQCRAFSARANGNETRTAAGKQVSGKSPGSRGSTASTPKTWTELAETMTRRSFDAAVDRQDVHDKIDSCYDALEASDQSVDEETVSVSESRVDQRLTTQLASMLHSIG